MANITEIDRIGFDSTFVSDKEDQYFFVREETDLYLHFVANGQVHAKEILSASSVSDIPSEELEEDYLNINLERSGLNQEQLDDALFFISNISEGEYTGITVILSESMEYPDLDSELSQALLLKNITIIKE